MPLEINELVIRGVVRRGEPCAGDSGADSADEDREAMIEECVKAVLKILKRSKER